MNSNWKFIRENIDSAWQQNFDDSNWESIDIPHDYSISEEFSIENSSGTGYLPGGVAWYRKNFYIKSNTKFAQLEFDGIYNNSMIWVNGYYMGIYENGYAPIKIDISHIIKEKNTVAVKVDHDSVTDSRWYTGSGIYRNCTLHEHSGAYIDEDDMNINTTYSNNSGTLMVEAMINNIVNVSSASFCIYNQKILIDKQEYPIDNGRINSQMQINNIEAWDAENPNLYNFEIKIDDEIIYTKRIGFVSYKFDNASGFLVNGQSQILQGVCIHHDAGCLGAAVPKTVWRLRLEKLKSAGVNAIRFSHNPHSKEIFELCDEIGFYTIAELFDEWEGAKNKWSKGHNVYPPKHDGYAKHFKKNYKADIKNIVLRDRNQTSLIMWSIGNEIDYPNDPYVHESLKSFIGNNDANKPQEELVYNDGKPDMSYLKALSKKIADEVRKYDDATALTIALAFPELSMGLGVGDAVDVIGFNYKEHLYEEMQEKHPDKVFIGSENSHSLEAWNYVLNTKAMSGQFLWTGFDFLGETTIWPKHGSSAGLIRVSNVPKFEYFVRKGFWTNDSVLELYARKLGDEKDLQKNWNFEIGDIVEVYCASTSKDLIIKLGEQLLPVDEEYNDKHGFYRLEIEYTGEPISVYTKTENKILKRNSNFSHIQIKECKIENKIGIYEISTLDSDNNLYIEPIKLKVMSKEGNQIIGLENGNLFDTTTYRSDWRETFEGKLIVYAKLGDIVNKQPFEVEIIEEKNE